ncbi:FecR family protein [Marinoscillum sp. MHG1-6]|uniref:FecR family protein n=1 Tax=Marinoscillum sp. MHG1-6 TaxID=2959627 RepID=UPI0021570A37|nr:FecR family protein [Marinoscillum sp. MHG1-6]
MEDIIIKECTNEGLTAVERLQLDRWLSSSTANRRLYHQIRLAVMNPPAEKRASIKEELWNGLNERINGDHIISSPSTRPMVSYWMRAAAVILLVLGMGALSFSLLIDQASPTQVVEVKLIEKMSMPGQKITTYLPDGTMVKLNSGSRLIVPDIFSGDERRVVLHGEAFFDVKRDESKPFIIETKDVGVRVLGTSFNVRSYASDESSTVAVATGKVAVSQGKSTEYLIPGEKVIYSVENGLGSKTAFDKDEEFGWKDNLLMLDGKNLDQIIDILERWYGVEFQVESDQLNREKIFSGKYKDPSLKMVLEGLSYVYKMNYEINNKTVTIK